MFVRMRSLRAGPRVTPVPCPDDSPIITSRLCFLRKPGKSVYDISLNLFSNGSTYKLLQIK